jgi:TatD DNase family protein
MVKLVDTHCHIYSDKFNADISQVLDNARMQGVEKILMPNVDLESIPAMLRLEAENPGYCVSMMGLHPCSVKEDYEQVLSETLGWFQKRDFIAVGEIGIDLYWDKSTLAWQQDAFRKQVAFAVANKKPVAMHTRNAMPEVMEILREFEGNGLKGVFHCYSEGYEFATEIIDMGMYFGIGGVLTYKNSGLADAVRVLPIDRIILETDAPYLAPVPFRGQRNEPAYVWHVAKLLAEIRGMSLTDLASQTAANAEALFFGE